MSGGVRGGVGDGPAYSIYAYFFAFSLRCRGAARAMSTALYYGHGRAQKQSGAARRTPKWACLAITGVPIEACDQVSYKNF